MINTTTVVNEVLKGYFTGAPDIEDFDNTKVLINGTLVVVPNLTIVESVHPGLYVFSYIPTNTGRVVIMFNNVIIAHIEVITKSIYSSLRNIEDEALGSWTWNKTLGELSLLRQDGTPLANFDVSDSQTSATRERTS